MTLSRVASESRFSAGIAAGLAVMLAAGVLLRFYRLDGQSLWLDELWTAAVSDPRLPLEVWLRDWILTDVHPPLYFYMLREWRRVFGDGETSLRLMSAVMSVGVVATVPLVQRWTQAVRQPLVLSAWLACSVGAILYAQEARPYALLLLLTTAATLLAVAAAVRMQRNEAVLGPVCGLAGIVVVAEYSHYFGALMGAALFGALTLFAALKHRRYFWHALLPGIVAGGILLPWLLFHSPHMADKFGGNFWVTNDWSRTFPELAGLTAGSEIVFLVVAAAIAGVLVARPGLLGRPDCFVPLVAMVLMLVGAGLISVHTPVITPRNLLILVPSFYVLATTTLAEAATMADGRAVGAAQVAAMAIVALSLASAARHLATDTKDEWRQAAAEIETLPGCSETTLQVYYWPEQLYAYYLPPSYRDRLRTVSVTSDEPLARGPIAAPTGACPLVLWAGHIIGEHLVKEVAQRLGVARGDLLVMETKGHMLILDRRRFLARREPPKGQDAPTNGKRSP